MFDMPNRAGRRKVGRSPKILITLPADLLARLDRVPKWEFGTRAEVIRAMIVAGLQARAAKHKKRK